MADLRSSRGPDHPAVARRPRRTAARFLVIGVSLALIAAACGGGASQAPASHPPASQPEASLTPTGAAPLGDVTIGSNYSDQVPKDAFAAMLNYCATQTTATPKINTVEHGAFQDSLNSYLQGTPDDVFTWFAGYRMRFFAAQGLATDISDVWATAGSNYTDAFKQASTGDDGKQYFIPMYNYPWVVIYRKSLFAEKGYTVPTTWAEFKTLAAKIQADGLVPLAFADKDGWPAMGTFDILNMRQNGYKFHIDLMAGKEKWTDSRVKDVFNLWKELLPFTQPNALGRTWQEGAQSMINKEAAMYFLGTFAGEQATDPAVHDDLDFFPFPVLGNQWDSELAIDAPIDGLMLSKAPKNPEGAKALLACVATGPAQLEFLKTSPNNVAAAKDADTSGYSPFQKKMAEIIGKSGAIAQFLDRDTRPDFAGGNAMQGFLQTFLNDPNQNLDTFLGTIQSFYDSLPPQ
ncbi:MAG: carbohydrate ABC transporter substrate-binding protein [Chloroflexi bacterium]|nr:carbohydrate ABC transporter substrate-binding protein [Chloroflexota bacterium]